MKKCNALLLIFATLSILSCGQSTDPRYAGYTDFEIETEECIDAMFEEKDADITEFRTIFENYFSSAQISNSSDPREKQYEDILSFWARPDKPFPVFKDRSKIITLQQKLGLTENDLSVKSQLDCLTDIYVENKADIDTASSYYTFGSILETSRNVPFISPGLAAGTLIMFMQKNDLKKTLYQKAVALLLCFDLIRLTAG